MKKTSNVISILIFGILLPLIFIANILRDFLDAWKVKTDLPEPPVKLKERISKTTYPENPAKDQNEWYQYINRQLN